METVLPPHFILPHHVTLIKQNILLSIVGQCCTKRRAQTPASTNAAELQVTVTGLGCHQHHFFPPPHLRFVLGYSTARAFTIPRRHKLFQKSSFVLCAGITCRASHSCPLSRGFQGFLWYWGADRTSVFNAPESTGGGHWWPGFGSHSSFPRLRLDCITAHVQFHTLSYQISKES